MRLSTCHLLACRPPHLLEPSPTSIRGKRGCQRLKSFHIYFPPCVAFPEWFPRLYPLLPYPVPAALGPRSPWALICGRRAKTARASGGHQGSMPVACLCQGEPCVSEGVTCT